MYLPEICSTLSCPLTVVEKYVHILLKQMLEQEKRMYFLSGNFEIEMSLNYALQASCMCWNPFSVMLCVGDWYLHGLCNYIYTFQYFPLVQFAVDVYYTIQSYWTYISILYIKVYCTCLINTCIMSSRLCTFKILLSTSRRHLCSSERGKTSRIFFQF